jgi:hypothetical protein
LLTAASVATAGVAHAQTPEDRASARTLGIDAVHLADSGDCAGAIPKFEAAEKLFHAPTTLERLGECQVKVGRLVAGTENLNRVVREALPPNAPAPFVAAQAAATQLLAATTPRIAKLRIHVDGAPPDQVTVTVDGVNVPAALFDSDRPTDPGDHEVAATAAGFKRAVSAVRLADGAQQTVSLALEPDTTVAPPPPAGGAQVPPPSTAPPPAAPPAEPRGSSPALAFVALGVGGAGIVVGSVFGVLALGTKSTLDGACTNKSCPASSKNDIDSLSTQAWVSNIGFAVGAVGAVAGVVLLVTSHHGSEKQEATRAPHIEPWVGLGAAGLGGTFE